MRILALDTSTSTASIAVLDGERVVREVMESVPQRHLEWLAPSIATILGDAGWRAKDVEAVGVSVGPGGFTGLRIGVATAGAWAHARKVPVVALSTFEVIAEGVEGQGYICPVLDARRGEIAGSLFERNGVLTRVQSDFVGPVNALLDRLPANANVILAGDALTKYGTEISKDPRAVIAPRQEWIPRASVAGRLAWRRLSRGERDDPYRLRPIYARRTAFTLGKGIPPGVDAEELRSAVEEGEGR